MIFFVPGFCKLFTLNFTTMLLQNAVLYFYHCPEARLPYKCCFGEMAETKTLSNREQRVTIRCGEDQRLLTFVVLVINELLLCPAFTLEVYIILLLRVFSLLALTK